MHGPFPLNFSPASQFLFIRMSNAYLVVAGANVYATLESATVIGLTSEGDVIVPSSAFFPSWAASVRVARSGRVL
jgi:hypothetical protein